MDIPFFNYKARFSKDREVIKSIVYEVGTSDKFILKDHVSEFEALIQNFTGAHHAIAVSNGTYALTIGLAALGVGPDTDVITPAFSFVSSASTIVHRCATPIFVDVDESGMIDPDLIPHRITPRTKIVLPVHLFSTMANMSVIMDISRQHELRVLEDSAVSLGAQMDNCFAGLIGDIGVYSFFPAKPLGGIGDGGMIITNDGELAVKCRMLRNHGQDSKKRFYYHTIGYNSRMDELVGAYLAHRFNSFPELIKKRSKIAEYYNERLSVLTTKIKLPPSTPQTRVFYTYVIQVENRDELRSHLAQNGIETEIYYSRPLPLQPAFAYLGYRSGDFPVAEKMCQRVLALPLYPEMPDEHVEKIVDSILTFYA